MTDASSSAPGTRLSGGRVFLVVLTCALVAALEGYDIQALGLAAPILTPLLHLDPVETGQVFGGSQAGVVIGALLGGLFGDWWGRRSTLVISALVFGAFSIATNFAHDFHSLLWIRAATGLGLGAAMPNQIGVALDVASSKDRVKVVTAVMAGTPLGGACAALFAANFLKAYGWQSMFWLGGIIPLLLIPFILALPNIRAHKSEDAGGANPFAVLFGGGRALSTLLLWVGFFMTLSVLYMMLNWLPSLMTMRHFDIEVAHIASLIFNLASVPGAILMGMAVDRFGSRWIIPLGYVGLAAGMCGLAFLVGQQDLLIASGVTGFFLLGAQYTINGVSPMYYPARGRGLGTGASIAVGRLGSVVGPMMAGYVLKAGYGPSGVAIAMLPGIAIAAVAIFILMRQARVLAD